jgi:hypothetical protein
MPARRSSILFCTILVSIISAVAAWAQRVDPISADPDAVSLRPIWSRTGNGTGIVVAHLWDIDGNGLDEFGVADVGDLSWRIFSLDTASGQAGVLWQHAGSSPQPIAGGRFHGDGRWTLVLPVEVDTVARTNYYFGFFDVDGGRIADTNRMMWRSYGGPIYLVAVRYHIADLDLDGDDEFIVYAPVVNRDGVSIRNGEIWIYAGGPNFQVETPTVVIRDLEHHGDKYSLNIGRVDADAYPDLVGVTATNGRIRWGGPDLVTLDRPVDREINIVNRFLNVLDADGDGHSDLLWMGGFLHLSSSGKDPRSRTFDGNDADRHFTGRGGSTFVLGPLNDSADRYDMFGLNSALGDGLDLIFSGGHNGPDALYDATYPFVRQVSTPVGDVDGNGWNDFLAGDETAGDGLAVILGGGPYIPRDSMPASAIRDIALDGHNDAITIWPNPATDVVHIAWRGDLSRTPARFEVHDVLGRFVASGDSKSGRGEVVWRCAGHATGDYHLTLFDVAENLVASAILRVR